MIRRVFLLQSIPKATATDLRERCGRIEQRYVGQSGQSDGVKGSKTQVQNGDVTVTTLRKRVLTSGDKIG